MVADDDPVVHGVPILRISSRKRKATTLTKANVTSEKASTTSLNTIRNESVIGSVADAEKMVLGEFGLNDVDVMYSKLKVYMREQNKLDTKKPFKNTLKLSEEEAVMKVAQYLVGKHSI